MIIGQTSDSLEFLASTPSREIILTISGKGVNFNPPSIQFIPEASKVKIKRHTRVTVFQQGVLEVNYVISGANSEDYSVQFASSQAKLTVGNDSVYIPKYQKSAPIILATKLCESSTNLTLIVLPFQSKDLIYELQTFKRLRQSGWNILPRSIQFVQHLKIPFQTYFNGTAMEEKGISQGNLAMQVEINKQVIVSDSLNSTLEFNGTSTAEVGDLSKVSKR